MFTWLKRLFSPAPAIPQADSVGIYRVKGHMAPGTKPSIPSRATNLFPQPKGVDLVKPTTEADHYKWLDYGKVDTTLPPTVKTTPPPERTFDPCGTPVPIVAPVYGRSGSFVHLSGQAISHLCITGMVMCRSVWGDIFGGDIFGGGTGYRD